MNNSGGPEDTISAVATPSGEGGIGIIRISGPDTIRIASRFVALRSGIPLNRMDSHRLYLADITDVPAVLPLHLPSSSLTPIDEALVVYMRGPHSYTAEDVLEIHAHGGQAVLARILEISLQSGCRLASPGEFTKRAFLNGRLDLSQAESVLDTIKATSGQSLAVAQRHLRGDLKREIDKLRAGLLAMLAHLEAGIDFVEEDIEFVGREELRTALAETANVIEAALISARTGRVLREGTRVVIVGHPNVGKSSLLNRLLGESRAIVSNTPGTTRDLIEETVRFDGCTISLTDTAGLRETTDDVEREGIRRTKDAIEDADLLIVLVDASEVHQTAQAIDVSTFGSRNFIVVLNKIDLLSPELLPQLLCKLSLPENIRALPISTLTGEGLGTLRDTIKQRTGLLTMEPLQGVMITNVRHQEILLRCRDYLDKALDSINSGNHSECVAVDLRGAANALGEITGAITSDDILARIFSEFCIGK